MNARLLTFDCYGTLIDWDRGIRAYLSDVLARKGAGIALDDRGMTLVAVGEDRPGLPGETLRIDDVLVDAVGAQAQPQSGGRRECHGALEERSRQLSGLEPTASLRAPEPPDPPARGHRPDDRAPPGFSRGRDQSFEKCCPWSSARRCGRPPSHS